MRGLKQTDIQNTESVEGHTGVVSPPQDTTAEGGQPAGAGMQAPVESPYLAAMEQVERSILEDPAVRAQPTWSPLGPFSVPHGGSYGSGPGSRPSVSGRVSSIAIDPDDPSHILVGSAAGGVWETKDGGDSWHPRTDDQKTLTIGAVAFDPGDPSIAYAGTGEGNWYRRWGRGLLRSADGGTTWASHATTPFEGEDTGFHALVVDPLDGDHLLAATRRDLCESTDGGATWTVRHPQTTWDLSMHPAASGDPNSTNEVFAACGDGLQRSTDGGTTWSAVDLPGAPDNFIRMAVCHAPSDGNVVYAFAAGEVPNPDSPGQKMWTAYLWRRTTAGGAFEVTKPDPALQTNQAWYDWFAAVAPDDPDVLYLGAIEVHKGYRAASGMWTWSNISARMRFGHSIHPDQHAIAFSPADPNTIYIGNDGGVYRSHDAGTTWESLNKGLCITEIEYLAQHPQYDAWLIAGTQDNGTLRYEGSEAWPLVQDGDGGDCGVNASSPYTCFHSFYNMSIERSTVGGGWDTWVYVLGTEVPDGYHCLFYPPMEVNGNVVAKAGETVYISSDSGDTWTVLRLPVEWVERDPEQDPGTFEPNFVASALSIPTPTRILVGTCPYSLDTAGGDIYRIDQLAGAWLDPVPLERPRAGFVSDIYVDPTNANRIWVTYSTIDEEGHVYRSDDGGTTWHDVSAGLPDLIPVNAIVADPANTDIVYIGTDVGVYRSADAGGAWTSFSKGLPRAIVGDLLFHPVARVLRAGTRSRGVWEVAVDQPATTPGTQLYLRNSIVDTRRKVPSISAGDDPFQPGAAVNWWSSPDIKVDRTPFQTASLSDVDFEFFQDDRGSFAAGLRDEKVRGLTRVFVQAHNRGPSPASDVAVKVFYADASGAASPPPVPSGFWSDFPNNTVPADSPWQQIAPHRVVPSVEVGRPQVVGFEWEPPTTMGGVWLLAVVSAANDPVAAERAIAPLIQGNPKCGLKRVLVLP
jgi:photosystem II stability/assembly factor-like uncharacterized protein